MENPGPKARVPFRRMSHISCGHERRTTSRVASRVVRSARPATRRGMRRGQCVGDSRRRRREAGRDRAKARHPCSCLLLHAVPAPPPADSGAHPSARNLARHAWNECSPNPSRRQNSRTESPLPSHNRTAAPQNSLASPRFRPAAVVMPYLPTLSPKVALRIPRQAMRVPRDLLKVKVFTTRPPSCRRRKPDPSHNDLYPETPPPCGNQIPQDSRLSALCWRTWSRSRAFQGGPVVVNNRARSCVLPGRTPQTG